MKLVLYSGDSPANAAIDKELHRLIDKPRPNVAFIAADEDAVQYDFPHFSDHLLARTPATIRLFEPWDKDSGNQNFDELLKSDYIYLSGGNTFHLLKHLRKSKLINVLKDFVRRGGVMAGQSAGSIVMTPSISTASYPDFDCDDNYPELDDLTAMHLVNFEFFPHYCDEPDYAKILKKQSKRVKHPIYAVTDGAGIIVNSGMISFIGEIWCFARGKKFKLTP